MNSTVIKTDSSVSFENPSYIGYGISFNLLQWGTTKFTLCKCHVKMIGTNQRCVNDSDDSDLGTDFDIGDTPIRVRFPVVNNTLVLITTNAITDIGDASTDNLRFTENFKLRFSPSVVKLNISRSGYYAPASFTDGYIDLKKMLGDSVEEIVFNMFNGSNTFMDGRFEPDDFPSLKKINIQKLLKRECIFGDINDFPSSVESFEFWTTDLSGNINTLGNKTNLNTIMLYDCPKIVGAVEEMLEGFFSNGKVSGTIKIVLQQTEATIHNAVPTSDLYATFYPSGIVVTRDSAQGTTVASFDGVSWSY